jgi:hypothetical protein
MAEMEGFEQQIQATVANWFFVIPKTRAHQEARQNAHDEIIQNVASIKTAGRGAHRAKLCAAHPVEGH